MQKMFNHTTADVSYLSEGEGTPLVLLHGFAEDASVWNNQIDFFYS